MSYVTRSLALLALAASLGGCELIARFDESRLDAGDGGAVRMDAAREAETSAEAGNDAGAESALPDAIAPDAAMDVVTDAAADAVVSD